MKRWDCDMENNKVLTMSDSNKLKLITAIASDYGLDENLGDTTERIETILWISAEGQKGKNWGLTYKADEMG